MRYKRKYKFIASFLLLVFSLNTVAGFACSIGLDMGYNTKHHEHGQMDHPKGHTHKAEHKHKHSLDFSIARFTGINDDCCAGEVNNFALLDKSVPANNYLLKAPALPIVVIPTLFLSNKTEPSLTVNSRFQFVRRSCSLDDNDIRIAIQSFQI